MNHRLKNRKEFIILKKKAIILAALICSIGLLMIINYFDGGILVGSGNSPIEQLIIKSIKIQYRWNCGDNAKELNSIFTSDFIQQINTNPDFYKKEILLYVEKDFMNSLDELNQNQLSVEVQVNDTLGVYYQEIILTKDSNGNYKISEIEYDI